MTTVAVPARPGREDAGLVGHAINRHCAGHGRAHFGDRPRAYQFRPARRSADSNSPG
jgi:hypothetical protein